MSPPDHVDAASLSWERIRDLFHAALERPQEERLTWLALACKGDTALFAEVEALLRREMEAGSFLEPPSSVEAQEILDVSHASRLIGARIGSYRLLGLLGRGAMGLVYDAEQESTRRRVALKVMRSLPYLDELTPKLFQREVQALARMEHHGIATIHDAGRSDEGWCYFAMERIDGLPLTRYARERALSLRERLELFELVCMAVHYAHQRGVIHRDLKPSNILVTASGQPKVLDFGLARITDPGVEHAQLTQPGSFHGTLAYASPEQMRGRPDEIDVRTDVYTLGVILYELLAGKLPIEVAGLPLSEAARRICEHSPAPAGSIDRALRGELETVLRKALEKEPERRYASAAALGEDIGRYLNQQPILAHPPTTAYQLRKLITRHRLPFALAAALAVVLLASAVVTGWLAVRFAGQRNLALSAQTQASEARDSAEEFAGFLENLFKNAEPAARVDKEPSLRQVLDDGYERLPEIENPLVRARLMTVMGGVYTLLENFPRGRELIEAAVEIRRRELGASHPDLVASLNALASLHIWAKEYDAADAVALEILETRRREYGEDHPLVADAWEQRGEARYYAGDFEDAVEYFRTTLAIRQRIYDGAHEQVAIALVNLGRALTDLGNLEEAESYLRDGLAMRRELGDPAGIEWALEGLALLVWQRDRQEAEELLAEELDLAHAAYHPHHPRLAWILTNYAFVVSENHAPARAEPFYREAVEVCRGADTEGFLLARCLNMYGMCLMDQKRYAEAVEPLQESVEVWTRFRGAEDARTVQAQKVLDEALAHQD